MRDIFWSMRKSPLSPVTMRSLPVLLLACASLSSTSLAGQNQREGTPQTAQRNVPVAREEDGGVGETIESILVSAKPKAPFTLTLETEWVRTSVDGVSLTLVNKRRIARDLTGRNYQESWLLAPRDGNAESRMTVVQIADPNAHTLYICFFVGAKKNLVSYWITRPRPLRRTFRK